MRQFLDLWQRRVKEALRQLSPEIDLLDGVASETPPNRSLGDLSFPLYPYAKPLRQSPQSIAQALIKLLPDDEWGGATSAGPYLNIRYGRRNYIGRLLRAVESERERFGHGDALRGRKIMIEFSSPNTNKPLHLGHLRNNIIGESLARVSRAAGAETRSANLINDRGIHICKSMSAYRRFGNGETPETARKKPDHFVGEWYMRFARWSKEYPSAEHEASEMLRAWERGDDTVRALWKKMNEWAIKGMEETYRRTGISFDRIDLESDTYREGKEAVSQGLRKGCFYRSDDGAIMVDLGDIGLDSKVLLRGDGTSLYLTQDIGTAIRRREDWPFDKLIYVVASEQRYHFQVFFHVMKMLGYSWANHLHHLSYGMVHLPEGKMKSREGVVVDADWLLDSLTDLAKEEIRSRQLTDDSLDSAEAIALAAVHYYLLKFNPASDIIFDPKRSLSFNGDTGPYLQYVSARIASILRRAGDEGETFDCDFELLASDDEWELCYILGQFPQQVERSAIAMDVSSLVGYLYDLGRSFSRFYQSNPIATADDRQLRTARLALARATRIVLCNGLDMINISPLDRM